MPEARCHHVLNVSLLAVGKFYFRGTAAYTRAFMAFRTGLFLASARALPALRTRRFLALAGLLAADLAQRAFAFARITAALLASLRFKGFAVPLRITEVMVRLDEIVDGKIVLAVIQPGATTYNLLELDDFVNRPHQDNIADIASIDTGGKFLRGR